MTYHQSPDPEGEQRARDLAVEKHDREASEFDKEYRTLAVEGYLATAFLLGREKIDRILYRELERCGTGARVLDAGCGTGSQLAEIAGRGFDVVGLEPAIEMRRIAIEANPGVEIGSGSITAMPFPDASFDVVIALEVLRYLPETDNDLAWKEMLRVLRPGGTLIVTLVNRWAIDGYVIHEWIQTRRASRPGGLRRAHCEFTTPGRVRRYLTGLGVTEVRTLGRLVLPLRWAYKIDRRLGQTMARLFNPLDDLISQIPGTTPLAGHLVVVARQ